MRRWRPTTGARCCWSISATPSSHVAQIRGTAGASPARLWRVDRGTTAGCRGAAQRDGLRPGRHVTVPPPPSATYRLQFHAGLHLRRRAATGAVSRTTWGSATSTPRRICGRAPAACTATTWPTPARSTRSSARKTTTTRLVAELQRHGMGQLVDVVPNHMGIGDPGNYRWLDVLENGPASIYARFFDINWRPSGGQPQNQLKLVVPTLGDQYGKVLENGELEVEYADGAFGIAYYDHRFPDRARLPTRCCSRTRRERHGGGARAAPRARPGAGQHPDRAAPPAAAAHARRRRRSRSAIAKRRSSSGASTRCTRRPRAFRAALEARAARRSTASRATPRASIGSMRCSTISRIGWRSGAWRPRRSTTAAFSTSPSSRRCAWRTRPVFQDTHRLLMRLVGEGKIQGLRIDHPDGLRDPGGVSSTPAGESADALGGRRLRGPDERFYVVVEKILEASERLRAGLARQRHDRLRLSERRSTACSSPARTSSSSTRSTSASCARAPSASETSSNSTKKMVMLISLASEVNELGYLLQRHRQQRPPPSRLHAQRPDVRRSAKWSLRSASIAPISIPKPASPRLRPIARHRAGRRRRQAPQPAHRPVDLRLRRRHAAARRRPARPATRAR